MRNEPADKLAAIRTLSLEEIKGWRLGLQVSGRAPYEGEMSALASREKQLKEGR